MFGKPVHEAKILAPKYLNDGLTETKGARAALASALVREFGGATVSDANGLWKAPDGSVISEPMIAYAVAAEESEASDTVLEALAQGLAIATDQLAVYLLDTHGRVQFITKE